MQRFYSHKDQVRSTSVSLQTPLIELSLQSVKRSATKVLKNVVIYILVTIVCHKRKFLGEGLTFKLSTIKHLFVFVFNSNLHTLVTTDKTVCRCSRYLWTFSKFRVHFVVRIGRRLQKGDGYLKHSIHFISQKRWTQTSPNVYLFFSNRWIPR